LNSGHNSRTKPEAEGGSETVDTAPGWGRNKDATEKKKRKKRGETEKGRIKERSGVFISWRSLVYTIEPQEAFNKEGRRRQNERGVGVKY